jgi:hypothetical protein
MSTQIDILIKFKNILVLFIDELIEQFPYDSDLILCRIYIKDQIPVENIMKLFIIHFYPQKNLIEEKNELFFMEGTKSFFEHLKLKTNVFKKIWTSDTLDDEDRTVIWEWINSLLTLVDKYYKLESS